ncbi:MAG: MarR family transcriptional regulator [Planctomycetota bacterium]
MSSPPDDHALARELHSATLRLLRRLRSADESLSVSTARLSALSVLVFDGPKAIGELARIEQVSQPTMSNLVRRLATEGYVVTRADPADRRLSRVQATAQGRRLLHAGRRRRVALLEDLMADLGPRDRRTLARAVLLLRRIVEPR